MNKRILGGLAAAAVIGGGAYGFAATLDPVSDNLGAGGDAVESCDNSIDASYTASYTTTGYKVATVELSGIEAECGGEGFQITLSDSADGSLVELTGELAGTATQSVEVPEEDTVLAHDVEGIDLVVTGDNP